MKGRAVYAKAWLRECKSALCPGGGWYPEKPEPECHWCGGPATVELRAHPKPEQFAAELEAQASGRAYKVVGGKVELL